MAAVTLSPALANRLQSQIQAAQGIHAKKGIEVEKIRHTFVTDQKEKRRVEEARRQKYDLLCRKAVHGVKNIIAFAQQPDVLGALQLHVYGRELVGEGEEGMPLFRMCTPFIARAPGETEVPKIPHIHMVGQVADVLLTDISILFRYWVDEGKYESAGICVEMPFASTDQEILDLLTAEHEAPYDDALLRLLSFEQSISKVRSDSPSNLFLHTQKVVQKHFDAAAVLRTFLIECADPEKFTQYIESSVQCWEKGEWYFDYCEHLVTCRPPSLAEVRETTAIRDAINHYPDWREPTGPGAWD